MSLFRRSLCSLLYPTISSPPAPSIPPLPASFNAVPSLLFAYDPSASSWAQTQTHHPYPVTLPDDNLHIITWNVDFSEPHPGRRIKGILNYLRSLLNSRASCNQPEPDSQNQFPPTMLLFQEMHLRALNTILEFPWIRDEFIITNIIPMAYADKYGTVTLISRCLVPALERAFRVVFQNSVMGRDVLFVDLKIKKPDFCTSMDPAAGGEGRDESVCTLRIANTHLDWVTEDEAVVRAVQLKEVHKVLFTQGVYVGIVGGDMSATDPEDETLAEKVGFTDLWEAGGGGNDGSGGQTWGYQPEQPTVEPIRLDKILACGNLLGMVSRAGVETVGIGCDIELDEKSIWVSDHYGLMWVVKLGPA